MMVRVTGFVAAVLMLVGTSVLAAPLQLQPANPQPTDLQPGLSVTYAYPPDVRTLSNAREALENGSETGQPLKGLDHRNTKAGQNVLTATRDEMVAARITGYIKFDAPGTYKVDFLTNDGLHAKVGGHTVGKFDGRQTCDNTFTYEIIVPQAAWYPVDVLWFQRRNTACLHMRLAPKGQKLTWVPDAVFGH
ncbi:MAG: hypothetical protein AAGB28_15950 [Pseudomonadota bacterium]